MNNDEQASSKKCTCRCACGSSEKEDARFAVNSNGTVFDSKTNLTWQQEVLNETFNWKQAHEYARQLNLGGYNDWRLPTVDELAGIVDKTKQKPAIDRQVFPDTLSEAFWTS